MTDHTQSLAEALHVLERAATEVAKYGAVCGSQWSRMTAANLKARSALAAYNQARKEAGQ